VDFPAFFLDKDDMARIVVFGQTTLALELGELARELSLDACVVTLGAPIDALLHAWEGLPVLAELPHEAELHTLLSGADSALLCGHADPQNLDLALQLHEMIPALRVVISLSHPNLAREIEKLVQDTTGWCVALNPKEVAAPAFALAALENDVVAAFEHERQYHALVRGKHQDGLELAKGEHLIQAQRLSEFAVSREQLQGAAEHLLSHARRTPDLFLTTILLLVAGVLGSAAAFFHVHEHLPWMSSIYFVVTTFCTVGYGDISLKDSDTLAKAIGIALMLASMFLTASLFAILTNALLQMRTDRLEGRRRFRLRNHVIVCGMGSLGMQVVRILRTLRVKTLMIEKRKDGHNAEELADLKTFCMIADATQESVLERACLRRARSIVCAMGHDLTSIEIAISARMMRPALRSVVRIWGDVFATRLQRHLRLHSPLSVANQAAPVFLANAIHPRGRTLLRIGGKLQAVVAIPKGHPETGRCLVEGKEALHLVPMTDLDNA